MITRENIRELAGFESPEGGALSFYYQPSTPKDKSHREELILVKDLVRNALREAEKNGKNGSAREDLQKILELAERLHGNSGRAKAVFASSSKNNFWREYRPAAAPGGLALVRQPAFSPAPADRHCRRAAAPADRGRRQDQGALLRAVDG